MTNKEIYEILKEYLSIDFNYESKMLTVRVKFAGKPVCSSKVYLDDEL